MNIKKWIKRCLKLGKTILKPAVTRMKLKWKRRNARYLRYRSHRRIKEHTILYEAFYGRGMLDNPYALFCELLSNPAYSQYKHVWVLDDPKFHTDLIRQYKHCRNVSFVRFQSNRYLKLLATCKYLINNVTFYSFFSKREDQVYINTWHGIPLKCLGYDMVGGRFGCSNVVRNFLHADYLISANPFLSDIYKHSHMLDELFEGEIIEEGYPRLDLVANTDRQAVLEQLKAHGVRVDPSKKIIVYAPTWKGGSYASPDTDLEPYIQFKTQLEQTIDTSAYQVLIKVHQVVYKAIRDKLQEFDYIVPATVDANVLLSATDILISDYSSIFYDFLVTGRPVLFYIPDLENYTGQRGLYTTVDELPGPCTKSLTQLAEWINQIDSVFARCKASYDRVRDWCCDYEAGKISAKIVKHIFAAGEARTAEISHCKKKIVFFVDEIRVNGILNSLTNLLNEIDYDAFDVTVISGKPKLPGTRAIVENFHPCVRYLMRDTTFNTTLWSEYRSLLFHKRGIKNSFYKRLLPSAMYSQEIHRLFGNSSFDYSVDFCGFSIVFAMLAAHVPGAVSAIWMHSDMAAEQSVRMPWLSKMFSVYPLFDRLVSCSHAIMLVNRENLSAYAPADKFVYCKNAVNYQRVLDGLEHHAEAACNGMRYCLSKQPEGSLISVKLIPLFIPQEDGAASLDKQPTRFLMIGRLSPEKNYEAMILAFSRFVERYPDSMLYIVGDGPQKASLSALIDKLNMRSHIILVGLLDNPSILMPYCHCFVLSSLHEGQPVVLHEARVARLPIIMTKFSSYADAVIEDGQYLVESNEDSLLEGLYAFMEGRVPRDYAYDYVANNRQVYHEFLAALGEAEG